VKPNVLLSAVIGALSFLFAAIVIFDAYEKSIEQRMLAEVVVQKLRQNAEREPSRISVQRRSSFSKSHSLGTLSILVATPPRN
jgi:hypothetical protein